TPCPHQPLPPRHVGRAAGMAASRSRTAVHTGFRRQPVGSQTTQAAGVGRGSGGAIECPSLAPSLPGASRPPGRGPPATPGKGVVESADRGCCVSRTLFLLVRHVPVMRRSLNRRRARREPLSGRSDALFALPPTGPPHISIPSTQQPSSALGGRETRPL